MIIAALGQIERGEQTRSQAGMTLGSQQSKHVGVLGMRKLGGDSIGRTGGKKARRAKKIFAELFQGFAFVA